MILLDNLNYKLSLSRIRHLLVALTIGLLYLTSPVTAFAASIPIESLYHEDNYTGFSLSPSGNLLAYGDLRDRNAPKVSVFDLRNNSLTDIPVGNDKKLLWVSWATEERLLMSFIIEEDVKLPRNYYTRNENGKKSRYFRDVQFARMIAMDTDGTNVAIMMSDANRDLKQNYRLDRLTSTLPSDPDHVLVPAHDNGLNIYKVNIHDGTSEKVQDGKRDTFAYDVSRSGYAIARYDWASRRKYVKVYVRAEGEKKWTKLATVREEDFDNFSPVADTDTPGEIFVSATREGTDRAAIYRYDLVNKAFMEKVAEHPVVDVNSVITDYDNNYIGTDFTEHRLTYDFVDPDMDKHLKALNKALSDKMNVSLMEVSRKDGFWLVKTSGPEDYGTVNIYDPKKRQLDKFTVLNSRINAEKLSAMKVVEYEASDGLALSGYLTTPQYERPDAATPLVVLVHGGPHARDYYEFEPWSQYLASNGFKVFQPQFRGSSGYGKAFSEAGFGEWGGRMQDDVTEGVEYLIKTGQATRGKICIVGASYGGYAALMGAVKTPDLYECASSIAGVTDLLTQAEHDKEYFGKKSETWENVKKQLGDPKTDKVRMIATSPARQAKQIQIPIQLIHGSDDEVVPLQQSEMMRDALKAVKNPAEYIELKDVDHNLRGGKNRLYGRKETLTKLKDFLYEHLQAEDDLSLDEIHSSQ
ncbi:MAG: S9 family peptidase [Litorimonas sp.]